MGLACSCTVLGTPTTLRLKLTLPMPLLGVPVWYTTRKTIVHTRQFRIEQIIVSAKMKLIQRN